MHNILSFLTLLQFNPFIFEEEAGFLSWMLFFFKFQRSFTERKKSLPLAKTRNLIFLSDRFVLLEISRGWH